jgi:hypothetical protein
METGGLMTRKQTNNGIDSVTHAYSTAGSPSLTALQLLWFLHGNIRLPH